MLLKLQKLKRWQATRMCSALLFLKTEPGSEVLPFGLQQGPSPRELFDVCHGMEDGLRRQNSGTGP